MSMFMAAYMINNYFHLIVDICNTIRAFKTIMYVIADTSFGSTKIYDMAKLYYIKDGIYRSEV